VSDAGTGPARLEVIALDGIPAVHPGDDLSGLVGDALERTEGALPLRHDDLIVQPLVGVGVHRAGGRQRPLRAINAMRKPGSW
jgi:hypothetical protein